MYFKGAQFYWTLTHWSMFLGDVLEVQCIHCLSGPQDQQIQIFSEQHRGVIKHPLLMKQMRVDLWKSNEKEKKKG